MIHHLKVAITSLGILAFWTPVANAQLPFQNLTEKVIRESNPFAFIKFNPSVDLAPEDFVLEKGKWIPESMQWVRVGNGKDEAGILIPRARFLENGKEHEVALTQSPDNPVRLKFRPRASLKSHFFLDSSCSPYRVRVNETQLSHSWVMITCHSQNNTNEAGTKPAVLVTVLWENEVEGKLIQATFDSENRKQVFGSGEQKCARPDCKVSQDSFEIEVPIQPTFHHLGVSAGVGPYDNRGLTKAFVTIYGSYFLNDAFKVATFGAFPVRGNPEIDWGMYLVMEQFRGIDERISLNLLLGAHLLSYVPAVGTRANSVSGPQGVELIFRDLFLDRMNFTFGGFFYPKINERSYVNTWIRYGSPQFFLEFNYIDWTEPSPAFHSRSVGLSVGFPLFRVL
ncbi:MAG: hypothetical protein JNL01_12620 [Bdellovibrionales bacterium]|nr:hypothetical protein [Bdellovibrionales bacterium]